jgi:hypothetical protein
MRGSAPRPGRNATVIGMASLHLGLSIDDEPVEVPTPAARVRVLVLAAVGSLVTGYAAVAAILALVTAIASRAEFTTAGVLRAAGPGWLAAHQVPVRIEGHVLGALPLLPTIAAVALVARTASGALHRLGYDTPRQAVQVIAAVAGGHAVFGVALGLWCSGCPATVDPLIACCYPGLLAAVGAVFGVARDGGLLWLALDRIDDVALRGLRVGVLAVAALVAAGALVVVTGLVSSLPSVRELFAHNASGPGSGLGLLLLSAGYLPNAALAGVSFAAGPGFGIGAISVGPLDFAGGRLPGLPLLAALPERAAVWWPVFLVLPIGIGVLVGRLLRDADPEPAARLRAVGVATGVVAVTFLVLAGMAGGQLGGGRFDPVDLHATTLCLALAVWVGSTAAAVAWFGGPRPEPEGPVGLLDDEEEPGEEPEDEPEPELADEDLVEEIDSPEPTLASSQTDLPGDHADPS